MVAEELEAIARLKRGDITGLEVLVRAHQDTAIRTAYLIVHDRALSEDIVQAAFIRAYERIGQFDASKPFGPWFYRSVANDAVKAVRRRRRHVSLDDDQGGAEAAVERLPAGGASPHRQLEMAETAEQVWAAVQQLPPAQRAAVVLRYYAGLSDAEIADRTSAPPGTIRWRLHAARKRLRQLLVRGRALGDRLFRGETRLTVGVDEHE